jgi:hypothetical protein
MGISRLLLLLRSACPLAAKESQEKKRGLKIYIYTRKKRKMDKEEKEVDEQEEFNAKGEEDDFKKE